MGIWDWVRTWFRTSDVENTPQPEERRFDKLVRDNIPDIIREKGETPYHRILDDIEFLYKLTFKYVEEANELFRAVHTGDMDAVKEEMADAAEVFDSLMRHLPLEAEQLQKLRQEKDRAFADITLLQELAFKFVEVAYELLCAVHAGDVDEAEEKMADAAEVFNLLMLRLPLEAEQLQKIQQQKREKKGGFDKRIYLEYTTKGAA